MFPINHKTIFVLDHTPYFGISCEAPIEFDFNKSRTAAYAPICPPLSKSLWTCSVESAVEYCRIIWDLFPQGKLVRFIVSDNIAHAVNSWFPAQQNVGHVMNGMATIGIPPPPQPLRSGNVAMDYTVLHGLRSAIEVMSETTELQVEVRSNMGENAGKFLNKCRVICITSARDNESMKRLEEIFLNVLQQQNKTALANPDKFTVIDFCHLVIINTFPINIESQVSNHPPKVLSPLLTTEVHSIRSPAIPNKLSSLILEHYDLASTTVTGIPMKEEQNASSSANYDVEIYHASSAHTAILKGNAADSAAIRTVKEGLEYQTVTLKWCTPRGCSASELQNCTNMHRITPVDVNSRPSLCLINFLLNGRSVMLEMPRKLGGKITSHLLASHGGEIFIHSLSTARSVLEDPPSISEGGGGRVTDYRIPDFSLFIQQNKLVSIKHPGQGNDSILNKMKLRLHRHTKYWPMTISSTFIYNLKGYIEPLPTLITRDKITPDEVHQCKQVLYNLLSLESKQDPALFLPHRTTPASSTPSTTTSPPSSTTTSSSTTSTTTTTGSTGGKTTQRREDQYRQMWSELEQLLAGHRHQSEGHRAVYSTLLKVHKYEGVREDKDRVEGEGKEGEGTDGDARPSVIRATTDSPMSPPPLSSLALASPSTRTGTAAASSSSAIYGGGGATTRTFYDIFTAQERTTAAKTNRLDFDGRQTASVPTTTPSTNGTSVCHVAKLYRHLKVPDNDRGPREVGDKS